MCAALAGNLIYLRIQTFDICCRKFVCQKLFRSMRFKV